MIITANLKKDNYKEISFKLFFLYFFLLFSTVDPVYSERVGAAKSVHLRRVFTINVLNLTIN